MLCVGSVGLAFVYALGAVSQLLAADPEHRVAQQIMFEWLTPGAMQMTGGHLVRFVADWGLLLDPLSCVMVLVVTGVGFPDSRLFRRLHGARRRLLPLLRLHESFHVRDADAGAGEQSVADVCRLGRRRVVQLFADRILFPEEVGV